MVSLIPALLLVMASAAPQHDALVRARQAYNRGQYDLAIEAASEARMVSGSASAAALVLARAHLERYRLSADVADLSAARDALAEIRPDQLDLRGRLELVIGLGQSLYLDDQFGPAADLFESALANAQFLEETARERLLDWWATAMDRQAQVRTESERNPIYGRIAARMDTVLNEDSLSPAASYWLVASARAAGDLERAWDAAIAGWVRAPYAPDRGEALRGDLDRLVVQALIPERARRMAGGGDTAAVAAMLREEWEQIKQKWTGANPSLPSSSSLSPDRQ